VGSQLFWSRRREAYGEFVRTFGMPVYVGQGRGLPGRPAFFCDAGTRCTGDSSHLRTPLDFDRLRRDPIVRPPS
jgi:hypothetical protein